MKGCGDGRTFESGLNSPYLTEKSRTQVVAGTGHEECQSWLVGLYRGGLGGSVQAPGAEADGAVAVWVERAYL